MSELDVNRFSLSELAAADYQFDGPFELTIDHQGSSLSVVCDEVLRLLPGRRLVARTTWPGSAAGVSGSGASVDAVLKLFIGPDARRYRDRELAGLKLARDAGARVPELLATVDADQDERALIFRFVADSCPLDAMNDDGLRAVVQELARLHQAGVTQTDLKLANVLIADEGVWLVDGDGVRARNADELDGLAELATLLAERQPAFDDDLGELLAAYSAIRGWSTGHERQRSLYLELARARDRRLRRYLKKTLRTCSEYVVTQSVHEFSTRLRNLPESVWQSFADDPDQLIRQGEPLKQGRSATVARWQPEVGPSLVLKRYNVKSPLHALRRSIRRTPRPRLAWLNGQRLAFLAISTARPLALLERRLGPWRGVAYLLLEDLGDRTLEEEVAEHGVTCERASEVAELFALLRKLRLRHGDTKADNFLIVEQRVRLIDLDAMRDSPHGWRRDVDRFLDNWHSEDRDVFVDAFRKRGLLD
jgi:tRNA A-37 threonylcarbamoyl transferase component Bud32